jgi:hypothetical protein
VVVGFVDGEGCFSAPIFRNRSCRIGWQAQPTFAVVQAERSAQDSTCWSSTSDAVRLVGSTDTTTENLFTGMR